MKSQEEKRRVFCLGDARTLDLSNDFVFVPMLKDASEIWHNEEQPLSEEIKAYCKSNSIKIYSYVFYQADYDKTPDFEIDIERDIEL